LRVAVARAHRLAGRIDEAEAGLARAREVVARRAASLPDPELRERFLAEVPEHAALA